MTRRERVYRAIQHRDTDIVPYHVTFTIPAREKMVEYYGDPGFERRIGNHFAMLRLGALREWEEIRPGYFRDQWGVVWNRTVDKDIGNVEGRVLADADLTGWRVPESDDNAMREVYARFVEEHPDEFRIASLGFSLFERAWTLRGMEQLMVDMIKNPDFVHELFDRITEYNLEQVALAVEHDIDCIRFGDDWGSQSGLLMGPSLWREFIKPRIAKMYEAAHRADKRVMIHCCGDVKAVLPDLAEVGVDIFNPFQPEVMECMATKRAYQGRMSFYGGISVQRLLPLGTPEEVRAETQRLLRELGAGGGYIAAPSHDVPSDVPAKNMAAMIEVLMRQNG